MIWQEEHADTVFAGIRQLKTESLASILKESMRHLKQDSRTVTGIFLATASPAVIEILQNRERFIDDFVGFLTFDIDHESDAARIVLKPRIIKSLFGREVGNLHILSFARLDRSC